MIVINSINPFHPCRRHGSTSHYHPASSVTFLQRIYSDFTYPPFPSINLSICHPGPPCPHTPHVQRPRTSPKHPPPEPTKYSTRTGVPAPILLAIIEMEGTGAIGVTHRIDRVRALLGKKVSPYLFLLIPHCWRPTTLALTSVDHSPSNLISTNIHWHHQARTPHPNLPPYPNRNSASTLQNLHWRSLQSLAAAVSGGWCGE